VEVLSFWGPGGVGGGAGVRVETKFIAWVLEAYTLLVLTDHRAHPCMRGLIVRIENFVRVVILLGAMWYVSSGWL
jgi:hypothetical protein